MTPYGTIMILGWIFLIASWTPRFFVKNEEKRRIFAIVVNAFALGLFTAGGILLFA